MYIILIRKKVIDMPGKEGGFSPREVLKNAKGKAIEIKEGVTEKASSLLGKKTAKNRESEKTQPENSQKGKRNPRG